MKTQRGGAGRCRTQLALYHQRKKDEERRRERENKNLPIDKGGWCREGRETETCNRNQGAIIFAQKSFLF